MFKTFISKDEQSQVTLSNNEHSDKSSMMISSLEISVCFSMEVPAVCFTFTFSCFFLLCLVTFKLFTSKLLPQTLALFNVSNDDVTFTKNLQCKKKLKLQRKLYSFLFSKKSHGLPFHISQISLYYYWYINILLLKLTCQFVENFPASFYLQFE